MGKNIYSILSAKYYDAVVNKKQYEKEAVFYSGLLNKFHARSVLELGCGTGLYLVLLKRMGFDIEGLDLSKPMLKEVQRKDRKIKLYNRDMSNFKIGKKYDAVLCLGSSLIFLPNFSLIEKTLINSYNHLKQNSILILDLPNHTKEIKERNHKVSRTSIKLPKGRLYSTSHSYRKGDKWIEVWHGKVVEGKKILRFRDVDEEIIYSPKKLEASIRSAGFKILKIYGSANEESVFDVKESDRRIYLCRKNKSL